MNCVCADGGFAADFSFEKISREYDSVSVSNALILGAKQHRHILRSLRDVSVGMTILLALVEGGNGFGRNENFQETASFWKMR